MFNRMRVLLAFMLVLGVTFACDRPLAVFEEEDEFGTEVLLATVLYEPHLIRPKYGSILRNSREVILRWSWIPSAENYSVQVSSDTGFVSLMFDTISDTTNIRTTPLQGTTLYWRVRSNKNLLTSPWSDYNLFYLQVD